MTDPLVYRRAAKIERLCPHCHRWTWHLSWCIHCFAMLRGRR